MYAAATTAALIDETACTAACCFSQRGCAASLETVTHAFVTCPVLAPVWAWVCDTWAALTDVAPPRETAVLVVGDLSAWSPPPSFLPLWTLFRLAVLHAIWQLRCARNRSLGTASFTAGNVIGLACSQLDTCMCIDWNRINIVERAQVHARIAATSTRPAFTLDAFCRRWCMRDVFARVAGGPEPAPFTLHVCIRCPAHLCAQDTPSSDDDPMDTS
jgi:hypothetical protein